MRGGRVKRFFAIALAALLVGCANPKPAPVAGAKMITADAVVAFLNEFEALAEQEDFALIHDFIDEAAYFRFNDGDFIGRPAIRAVFEKTWRGDPTVKKARFYLSDIVVLTADHSTATATYNWHWEGSQGDKSFVIKGRGTRVLRFEGGRFRIVHEHLSRWPRP
jgi:ketosteroid isomerase-like protein